MALSVRANASTRCSCSKAASRTVRTFAARAISTRQGLQLDMANIAMSAAAAAMLLAVPLPSLASDSAAAATPAAAAPSDSAPAAPAATERTSTASSISFARVDMSVTEKLRQRDDNMAWKCKGVNMYDCDGELAEAAEKRFQEMANVFRGGSKP